MTHAPLFGEGDLGFGVAVKVVQLALHGSKNLLASSSFDNHVGSCR